MSDVFLLPAFRFRVTLTLVQGGGTPPEHIAPPLPLPPTPTEQPRS